MLSSFCSSLSIISLNVIEIETLRFIHLAPGARKMHQNALSRKPATLGLPDNADQNLFFRIRSSDFVDYLEATDCATVRPIVVGRRDVAIVGEVQDVRVVTLARIRRY